MIISHKYKFIFIKTEKTAGTSIEVFLARHCGRDDVVTPIMPAVDGHEARNHRGLFNPIPELRERPEGLRIALRHMRHGVKFYNHMTASLIRGRVPSHVWNEYFKFCVERNPWDKLLSHYHMMAARRNPSLSLDDYLARGKFPSNAHRYTDAGGSRIIVDRVLRYENLSVELTDVFGSLKIPFDGNLGVWAKAGYRTDRTPYQQVFSAKQREIVDRAFRKEIEFHGYCFGE